MNQSLWAKIKAGLYPSSQEEWEGSIEYQALFWYHVKLKVDDFQK